MLNLLRRDRRLLALISLTAVVLAFSAVSALGSSPKPVKVGDNFFSAKRLTIQRGTKVTWNWVGVLRHNVVVETGPAKFHSKKLVIGTYSHRFTKKGKYVLYCTLHPFMKMTVTVK